MPISRLKTFLVELGICNRLLNRMHRCLCFPLQILQHSSIFLSVTIVTSNLNLEHREYQLIAITLANVGSTWLLLSFFPPPLDVIFAATVVSSDRGSLRHVMVCYHMYQATFFRFRYFPVRELWRPTSWGQLLIVGRLPCYHCDVGSLSSCYLKMLI